MESGEECHQEAEAIVPDKIIQVATGKQSLSVVGECTVGNIKGAFREGFRKNQNREKRRCTFVDGENALSWTKLTQAEIGKIKSQLANDVEEEVLYSVKKKARCKYKGRVKPTRWVYQKVGQEETKAEGLARREYPAGLRKAVPDVCTIPPETNSNDFGGFWN